MKISGIFKLVLAVSFISTKIWVYSPIAIWSTSITPQPDYKNPLLTCIAVYIVIFSNRKNVELSVVVLSVFKV